MNKKLLLIGILLIGVVLTAGCVQSKTQAGLGSIELEFSSGPCMDYDYENEVDFFNSLPTIESQWIGRNTLQVLVTEVLNCGEKIHSGDFKMVGDEIILNYNSPSCGTPTSIDRIIPCAECDCPHEMTYSFSKIEKKEYTFKLERIE